MSEFSDQSNSFDGEYIPEHPDTEHAKYNGSDPMTPPDFYPGQADQQPTMHPDAEIDTAPFTTEFHPPDHPEVRFEDVQPVTEATKYELMDVILAIADEGMHVPELRDDKGIVIHEFVAHVLVTADDEEELRVHFYPKGVPKPKGDPLIGSVTIKPKTDNALAAFSQTIYRVKASADRLLSIEKSVMLETSVSPRAEADEEQVSDRLYAMTERFGRNVDNAGEIRADQQQCRELGLAFVSETEAQALIAKLADASPEES